ncbi:hypothetical protein F5144DRAFT_565033 [Chaetomium tenue]|uniref:Uncharacterized protein n=1 Tax=Chaetomium tenue TaxID=1854479 RepID=A0ACB7PJR5_9PEZI|nr:hypothetical protein F5144DRAFT_565033 [Chaetomium globosum]
MARRFTRVVAHVVALVHFLSANKGGSGSLSHSRADKMSQRAMRCCHPCRLGPITQVEVEPTWLFPVCLDVGKFANQPEKCPGLRGT